MAQHRLGYALRALERRPIAVQRGHAAQAALAQTVVVAAADIVAVLNPDRKADVAGRHAAGQLIGWIELRVRGASRMDGQRTRIADVCDVIKEL